MGRTLFSMSGGRLMKPFPGYRIAAIFHYGRRMRLPGEPGIARLGPAAFLPALVFLGPGAAPERVVHAVRR